MTWSPHPEDLIKMIDAACLNPEADETMIRTTCSEAVQFGYAAVFAMSGWLPLIASLLNGSPVKTGAAIGFPFGSYSTVVKTFEVRDAIASGADEIDVMMNIGALKSKNFDQVRRDIESVVNASQGLLTKVILETCLLTDEEKVDACKIAEEAGADYVKTSTGFGAGGATVADVRLLRASINVRMRVKASGGIQSIDQIQELFLAGATRFGVGAAKASRFAREAITTK